MIKIQQNDIDTKSPPTTQSVTAETLPTLLAQVLKNNDINLLSYLVKCQTNENYLPIYKEFMFQCCEMGKSFVFFFKRIFLISTLKIPTAKLLCIF